ncbi:MAG: hypothetical protein U1E65_11215 [Myxococcota bacterium]
MTQEKKRRTDEVGFGRAWSALFGEYREGIAILGRHGLEDAFRVRQALGLGDVDGAYELMSTILGSSSAVWISRFERELDPTPVERLTPPGVSLIRTSTPPAMMRSADLSPTPVARENPLPRFTLEPRSQKPQMLGRYLLSTGRITLSELTDAILWQRAQRPAVGRIAMDWRILSADQVVSILREKPYNELFCAYAVRAGLMTSFHQTAIVAKQRRLQQPIGRYFVERGILSKEEVEDAVNRARGG